MAFFYENPKKNPDLLEKALDYLNGLEKPEQLLTEISSYHGFYYIAKYCNIMGGDKKDMLTLSTKSIEKILIKALDQLYSKREDISLNQGEYANINEPTQEPSVGEKCSSVLLCILYCVNIISKMNMLTFV